MHRPGIPCSNDQFLFIHKHNRPDFGTRIKAFMLQLAGGNYFIYAAIIALEGLLFGAALVYTPTYMIKEL